MSTLHDHAFPMLCICTLKLHDSMYLCPVSLCTPQLGGSGAIEPFCRYRFSSTTVVNSGIPWSMVATLGFAWFGKNATTHNCLREPPDSLDLGISTKGILLSLH